MSNDEIEIGISQWANARGLTFAQVEKWLALDPASRSELLELARRVKFRTGQFLTTFELLEEIAVRENQTIAEILARPAIGHILRAADSGPGKARALIEELRLLRYARLNQMNELLKAEIAALGLPRGIKIVLPRELGSDEVRIEIVAHGDEELADLLRTLNGKVDDVVQIAAMLGGAEIKRRVNGNEESNR
jgi:hypothetical protein